MGIANEDQKTGFPAGLSPDRRSGTSGTALLQHGLNIILIVSAYQSHFAMRATFKRRVSLRLQDLIESTVVAIGRILFDRFDDRFTRGWRHSCRSFHHLEFYYILFRYHFLV